MSTIVLTAFDDYYAEIGELTAPIMLRYASKHNMDFICLRDKKHTGGHPYWWKVLAVQECLTKYDCVIWIDADMVVTNDTIVPPGDSGLHISLDWSSPSDELWRFSFGCFKIFKDAIGILEWAVANKDRFKQNTAEQYAMQQCYRESEELRKLITVHPRRVFNAVHIDAAPDKVLEPWQMGDWLCHLSMPLERRIPLCRKLIKELVAC